MKNSLKIKIDLSSPDHEAVSRAITLLESFLPAENAEKETKPKAEPKKEAKPKAEPKAETPKKEAPKSSGHTIDQVREALALKVDGHRDSIRTKLTELGAKNVTTLDAGKYDEFVEYLESLKA